MWFLAGLLLGAGVLALALWSRARKIVVRWYEWFIGVLGLLLLLWTVHDFFASMAEYNEIAAWTFLWMLGGPAIILLVIAGLLPWLRRQSLRKGE